MTASFDQTDVLDLVVVGGGAAGLSGAKIAARARRTVLLVDAGAPRNGPAEGVHNYLYAEGTAPARLAEIGRAEAAGYGVQIVNGTAVSAAVVPPSGAGGPRFTVTIDVQDCGTRTVSARRLLLATGVVDVLPDIAGLRERWGTDVLHCPFCHGWEVRDQAIGVIGSGPTALHAVQLFRTLTDDVIYLQHTAPDPTEEQLEVLAALSVPHVVGSVERVETADDALTGVRLATGDVVAREALAVAPFVRGRSDLLADLDLRTSDLDMGGVSVGTYVPTDPTGLTGTPGVWAAGNLANLMAQVVTSASAGSAAGAAIHMDLMAEDSAAAVAAYRERHASRDSSDIPPQM